MTPDQALNFRDKTRMKDHLRAAGVPVARHRLVETAAAAREFAREVGYPLVVKPPAGAASQTTYRVNDDAELLAALGPTSLAAGGVALLEEFVIGEEHSFDAFVEGGRVTFYSLTNYLPTPLVVMQNPWMQWMVVLPRENEQADVAEVGARTLATLGLEDGMCHLEWFRRADGSLVVSEVAARPPGAQFPTMIARAHEFDAIDAWARLAVGRPLGPLPARKYAAGAAYLRGQGQGRVRAVHGFETVRAELGDLITDVRLPTPNQEKSLSYEGEGFVIVRHAETRVVEEALRRIVSTVRVELGG
jgi:biotin carboxylase